MLHDELRHALQHKIEDLLWGGPTMAPVLDRVARHADGRLLESYDQLLLLPGCSPR